MDLDEKDLKTMANAIRFLSADAVQKANSGHPGMPMGMAEVATVLFTKFIKINPADPEWFDRDRFVLSAGHGSMLLYSLLHLLGYEDFSMEDLKNFRQLGSRTAGHPEFGHGRGIETTTGPLGQGIANAVGMALAEKVLSEQFGRKFCDHYTYVIAGDGCLMEGISQEAISLAGHLGLNKLILLFDDNSITIDGNTNLATGESQADRFIACGWSQVNCDGHSPEQIEDAIFAAQKTNSPTLVLCKTQIGYGSPGKSGKASAHGSPLGEEELQKTRENLNWNSAPFEIPEEVLGKWREAGKKSLHAYKEWQDHLEESAEKEEFMRRISGQLQTGWNQGLLALKKKSIEENIKEASRKSGQNALEALVDKVPEFLGGSADLTGSNLTKASAQVSITPKNFNGGYVHYGVREHLMGAAMNGVALHRGLIPYGGTFLVFSDYCRPAIRLSALMKQRVVYVFTHDSIGLGEDGPTHQPVEHLSALRAIPNLLVFRPCDLAETAEAWEIALSEKNRPSALCLSRQGLPNLRKTYSEENSSCRGAYVLEDCEGEPRVSIFATGSEVSIACQAKTALEKKGVSVRVISAPCLELFDEQPSEYRNSIQGNSSLKVAIEAGIGQSWHKYIGSDGVFVGMQGFGASGPAEDLYEHFGITVTNLLSAIQEKL